MKKSDTRQGGKSEGKADRSKGSPARMKREREYERNTRGNWILRTGRREERTGRDEGIKKNE